MTSIEDKFTNECSLADNYGKVICSCGKKYDPNLKFSIYDKNFCSIACLKPYKEAEDKKRNPIQKDQKYMSRLFDGGACC